MKEKLCAYCMHEIETPSLRIQEFLPTIVLRVSHQVWVSERWGVAVSAAVLVYWQEVEA